MTERKYEAPRNRIVAALISAFFGGFGGQKFYLRQPGIGIFMILAIFFSDGFAFPFFALFGIIEAVRLLSMGDQEFDKKYNRYSSQNRRDDYIQQRNVRKEVEVPNQRNTFGNRSAIQKANPFKSSGLAKYKEYEIEGAIEDFSRGLDINPQDVALHFNIACAYSLIEEKEKAFYHLSKAIELGYTDVDTINTKEDLAYIRIQPEFEAFKNNGYKWSGSLKSRPPGTSTKTTVKEGSNEEEDDVMDDVLLSQLNKLAELRNKGLLSADEFELERKRLLRR